MKYSFCGKPVLINAFNDVYDRNGRYLGKCVKTTEYEKYLVGPGNKGPIELIEN